MNNNNINFELLKRHFGTHKKVAQYLGISYSRYNEWRWRPEEIPEYSRKLLELAIQELKSINQGSENINNES